MGQTHSSKKTSCRDYRLYCENGSCHDPITHYCSDHNQVLCASCSAEFHENCKCAQIPAERDVAESLYATKALISLIRKNSAKFKESSRIQIFNEEFEILNEMLSMMDKKFANSINKYKSYEFCSIMEEVLKLQQNLIKSNLFAQCSKLKEIKQALDEGCLTLQMIADLQRNINENSAIDDQQKETHQLDKNKWNKTINTTNQIKERMLQIKDCGQDAEDRLEEQKHEVTDFDSDIIRQRELNLLKHEHKIQEVVFDRIYERHMNKNISCFSSFNLKFNLNRTNNRSLLRGCVNSRLRLPNLNGIRVDCISDANTDLISFFSDCTPSSLCLLAVNCVTNSSTGINPQFFIDAFSEAAWRTTKEVYLNCIHFSVKDFQTVIRASFKAEKIVFNFCSIHYFSGLDFGTDFCYKTKFLSFQQCGHTSKNMTTDWK